MRKTRTRTGSKIALISTGSLAVLLLISMLTAGCMPPATGKTPSEPVSPVPSKDTVTLTLYFGDDQAMEVLPERRVMEVPSDPSQRPPLYVLVVQELLKGPTDPLLRKTLPPEAKLLSVQVTDGLALVNFSREVQTKHWGGSTGEAMSLLSLVNSLTELPEIQKVQILVEGQKVETLAGHFDVTQPLARAIRTGDFFTSEERAKALQARVDQGQDLWRKDPLEVAKRESGGRGLLCNLEYKLVSKAGGQATVSVEFNGKTYVITLNQPQKQGDQGIWVIKSIGRR
jgi:hypothetical protein